MYAVNSCAQSRSFRCSRRPFPLRLSGNYKPHSKAIAHGVSDGFSGCVVLSKGALSTCSRDPETTSVPIRTRDSSRQGASTGNGESIAAIVTVRSVGGANKSVGAVECLGSWPGIVKTIFPSTINSNSMCSVASSMGTLSDE